MIEMEECAGKLPFLGDALIKHWVVTVVLFSGFKSQKWTQKIATQYFCDGVCNSSYKFHFWIDFKMQIQSMQHRKQPIFCLTWTHLAVFSCICSVGLFLLFSCWEFSLNSEWTLGYQGVFILWLYKNLHCDYAGVEVTVSFFLSSINPPVLYSVNNYCVQTFKRKVQSDKQTKNLQN